MYRRDFLKLTGLFSVALFVQFNPSGKLPSAPVEAASHGNLYRGTSDGKILMSANNGMSWQLHTDFGSEFSIFALTPHSSGHLHAQLEYQNHGFELALAQNGTTWMTM